MRRRWSGAVGEKKGGAGRGGRASASRPAGREEGARTSAARRAASAGPEARTRRRRPRGSHKAAAYRHATIDGRAACRPDTYERFNCAAKDSAYDGLGLRSESRRSPCSPTVRLRRGGRLRRWERRAPDRRGRLARSRRGGCPRHSPPGPCDSLCGVDAPVGVVEGARPESKQGRRTPHGPNDDRLGAIGRRGVRGNLVPSLGPWRGNLQRHRMRPLDRVLPSGPISAVRPLGVCTGRRVSRGVLPPGIATTRARRVRAVEERRNRSPRYRGRLDRRAGGPLVLWPSVPPRWAHRNRIPLDRGGALSALADLARLHRVLARGLPPGRPLTSSRNAASGSFAFTTPEASRTPTVPSSSAFATSFRDFTPAPHRTPTFGFAARIRWAAPASRRLSGGSHPVVGPGVTASTCWAKTGMRTSFAT